MARTAAMATPCPRACFKGAKVPRRRVEHPRENWHPDAPVPRGLQRQQILATRDPFLSLVCAYQ